MLIVVHSNRGRYLMREIYLDVKKKRTSLQIPFRISARAYMRIPILSAQYGHNINSEHYK